MAMLARVRRQVEPILRPGAWDQWLPARAQVERHMPPAVAAAVVLGLVLVALLTPIIGRGDYGQWLMTSRHYLGEPLPGYREVEALPPLVPVLLAVIRVVIPDPLVALSVLNALLLAALGTSFYLLGSILLSARWAGVLTVAAGFLVTDRFLELFAFGGLLQVSAITFLGLSLVAFAQAAQATRFEPRWWGLGTVALALTVLSHVGTGLVAVPVAVGAAALAMFSQRHHGWPAILRGLGPVLAGMVVIAVYCIAILLPAGENYVTNPASLAYRGPERLFSSLFSYWPTSVVVAMGGTAVVVGGLGELLRRRIGGNIFLLLWLGATWAALAFSILSGAGTDYPRFATVLLAPLVVGTAQAMLWLAGALATNLRSAIPRLPQAAVLAATALLLISIATPFALSRHGRQAAIYQPRDAQALHAASLWIDAQLGNPTAAVVADVRDGKWLEGVTGREALFSLPVRYAFRPAEWQRSLDADALLRSTVTLTSGLVSAMFIGQATAGETTVPTDLLLRLNHGGEFVDFLRLTPTAIEINSGNGSLTAADLRPVRSIRRADARQVTVTTVWASSEPDRSLTLSATTWEAASALRIRLTSAGNGLTTLLAPPGGSRWTVERVSTREATVCLPAVGGQQPCARVWVGRDAAYLSETAEGALRVSAPGSGRIELLVTALTAGTPSVNLSMIDPRRVVADRNVRAALLWTAESAYEDRAERLEALGFHAAASFGPYQVMLRDEGADR